METTYRIVMLLCALLLSTAAAWAGDTTRVSVGSAGVEGDDESFCPSISANGRFIAFGSYAGNLVPDDTNAREDAFLHDRKRATTRRVSVDSTGGEADGGVLFSFFLPSVSANGRSVAFSSESTNLVAQDSNRVADIFVREARHR